MSRPHVERKNSSRACLECRRKKIKCDGSSVPCSNCILYGSNCQFGGDGRRKHGQTGRSSGSSGGKSSKSKDISHMEPANTCGDYMNTSAPNKLDAMVTEDWSVFDLLDMTQFGQDCQDVSVDRNGEVLQGQFEQNRSSPAFCSTSSVDMGVMTPGADLVIEEWPSIVSSDRAEDMQRQPCATTHDSNAALIAQEVRFHRQRDDDAAASTTIKDDEYDVVDELSQKLSSRLGGLHISGNGAPRYYGVTSNLHMANGGFSTLSDHGMRTTHEHGETAIRQLELEWTHNPIYEKHLLDLYFAWHDPFLHEVHRTTFEQAREAYHNGEDAVFYSPALENAMWSVGALYLEIGTLDVKRNASEFFASRARVYLDIELDAPTIATAQALIVMCCYEGANGGDSRGYMYTGMARQVIVDLGLHLKTTDHEIYSLQGEHYSRVEATVKKNIFWAAYTAEIFWGFYTGRPAVSANLRHNMAPPEPLLQYEWTPYTKNHSQDHVAQDTRIDLLRFVPSYLTQIATKMAKISNFLYSGISECDCDVKSFVTSMTEELDQLRRAMPVGIYISTSPEAVQKDAPAYPPMIIQLNMQYHAAMILLHRPLVGVELPSSGNMYSHSVSASNICTRGATAITHLLVKHRQQFSWRYVHLQVVHTTTIAGIVHAYDACIYPGERGKNAQNESQVCMQALGEMASSFKSSLRGLEIIAAVRRDWTSKKMVQIGSKRPRGSMSQRSRLP